MILSVLQIIAAILLPVLFSAFFYHQEKREKWRKRPYLYKQMIIGICFGGLAIFSTEFGIPVDGAILNVRSAAPVAAGLIFGWVSGVVAGLIGGIERWFATLWGVGEFTRLACTLGTIIAGFLGAAARIWLLDDRKPGWFHGLAVGVTAEVVHMLMVFLTNSNDIQRAFLVVQKVSIPMITATGISVMASVIVINRMSGRKRDPNQKIERISQTFQRWLLICVMAAFAVTMLFTARFQTQLAEANTDQLLSRNIADVKKEITEASDSAMLRITEQLVRDITETPADINSLNRLADIYQVTEINVVDENGFITASTHTPFVGYDMSSGRQSAAFLSILYDGKKSYVQNYQPISADHTISRKYAAVAYKKGFIQVGYDAERFQREIYEQVVHADNRHIGQDGFILICNEQGNIIGEESKQIGENIYALGHDESKSFAENEQFEAVINGAASCCMYSQAEGYYILAVLPKDEAMFYRNVAIYVLAFMETLVFAALFAYIYFLIKNLIVNNIQKINHSLSLITHGNLDVTVNVRSNEEFASLSNDINTTVGALRQLIDEAAKRIDQELEFARQIQLSALPSVFPPYPNRNDLELFACMHAAKEVGGDFYDFYLTDENHISLAIADVSGKGIPAAMFMMKAKTLLKSSAETGMPLNEAFTHANQQLFENNKTRMFVTAWMANVDLRNGCMTVANAGHNPPLLKRRGQGYAYFKTSRSLMLAASKKARYQYTEIQLEPGDELFLYTDGVTEATNAHNELYGEERLLKLLNSLGEIPMEEVCARVKEDVDAFVGEAPQFDDMTMLGFRYKGGVEDEGNNTGSDD